MNCFNPSRPAAAFFTGATGSLSLTRMGSQLAQLVLHVAAVSDLKHHGGICRDAGSGSAAGSSSCCACWRHRLAVVLAGEAHQTKALYDRTLSLPRCRCRSCLAGLEPDEQAVLGHNRLPGGSTPAANVGHAQLERRVVVGCCGRRMEGCIAINRQKNILQKLQSGGNRPTQPSQSAKHEPAPGRAPGKTPCSQIPHPQSILSPSRWAPGLPAINRSCSHTQRRGQERPALSIALCGD